MVITHISSCLHGVGLFGPKRHTKSIGEYSEVVIVERPLRAGYKVLTPYGDSLRYDLVIEDADEKFWRVQCKTAWLEKRGSDEVVKFSTSSNHYHYWSGRNYHARHFLVNLGNLLQRCRAVGSICWHRSVVQHVSREQENHDPVYGLLLCEKAGEKVHHLLRVCPFTTSTNNEICFLSFPLHLVC